MAGYEGARDGRDGRGGRGGRGDGRRQGGGRGRRGARAEAAAEHIREQADRYAKEIEASAAGTRRIDGTPRAGAAEPAAPRVTVAPESTADAVLARGRGRVRLCDMAVLDFASFTQPGGGYDRGAWGQEQAMCSESFLYNVLERQGDWYRENRRRNINCELYRNRALAVPGVRFTRDNVHAYADVIVAAAPDARRAREEYGVDEGTLARAMRDRIRFALAVADSLGKEKLVLGAYGCGAFGWDAEAVAKMFFEELATGAHAAREVVFAVPETRHDEHYAVFAHVLGGFPEANPVPYAEAKAAADAERAAADAAAEDEDEEDDWRKYL